MSEKQNIIIIGSLREKHNYLGVRTFYLYELLKKYLPTLKIGIYDVLAPDSERIELKADNFVFLPWVSTIDLKWCSFLLTLEGPSNKILFTDDYYWYTTCKNNLMKEGFNLENLFNTIAFSNRENTSWWNDKQYSFWGISGPFEYFDKFNVEKDKNKYLFVDKMFSLEQQAEPYNAKRIIQECIPIIKKNHPELKIISQNTDSWVDEKIASNMDMDNIIKYYAQSDGYIVTQHESCGLAQFDCHMVGTKIITNKLFTKSTMLLPGIYTYEQWSFEDGNKSFIQAVENTLTDYDKNKIKELSKIAYDEKVFVERVKKDLFNL